MIMSTSRRSSAFLFTAPLLALWLAACTTSIPSPGGAETPAPSMDATPSSQGAPTQAPTLIYGGDCGSMSTNAPDGWVDPVMAGSVPATWTLQISALGGIECHRQGDESATIIALPAELRPTDGEPEGVGCPQALECAIDVVVGSAWISGWVAPAAGDPAAAESFVAGFVEGLVPPDPLPARQYPSPTGLTVCDDSARVDALERALEVEFSDALTETQYGGYAPAITEVANRFASRCNLVWADAGERRQAEVTVMPSAGWTIAGLASGAPATVAGAEEARWIVSEDPFEFGRLVVRAGDDLVLVSVDSDLGVETASVIAEAALFVP